MKIQAALFLALFTLTNLASASSGMGSLKTLPVQDGGRIKPLDTFARESLELVYGKSKYEGRPALEIVLTWLLQPQVWMEKPLVEIRHNVVKKTLRFDSERMHFSMKEILANDRLSMLFQDLASHRETKEKLDPYYQAVQRLENQLFVFREIAAGRLLKIAPPRAEQNLGENWLALQDLDESLQTSFLEVTKSFIGVLGSDGLDPKVDPQSAQANLDSAVKKFEEMARSQNPSLYPNPKVMQTEVHYSSFHPFRWAWAAFLISFILMGLTWVRNAKGLYLSSWGFAFIGLIFNIYGFALRIYLTGRAPVSNMYETVVWVGFGALIFAMIIEVIYKWKFILLAGSAVAAFCLILADMAPVVLDPTLQPLEPVLRSNFWLTVHVLTITISYAAFFLAFALGDIGLIYFLRGENENSDRMRALTLSIYRSTQIGVGFLAPGIILGGVWADYSWGRFWGWDPKETWALIALLGYIAVLHARLVGWIRSFGMVCTSVLTFSLVIMAWYGVNFVLGAGLHSYGFGAGGVEYVAAFVAFHILFVLFVTLVRRSRNAKA